MLKTLQESKDERMAEFSNGSNFLTSYPEVTAKKQVEPFRLHDTQFEKYEEGMDSKVPSFSM